MSQRIPCPSCGSALVAPESARGATATCPRCLAAVAVPETPGRPDAVQAGRTESGPTCPGCGREVKAAWVTCPWCEQPLRGISTRRSSADLDVRRDMRRTSGLMIALAVVGMWGVLWVPWFFGGVRETVLYLIVGLLFLAGLSTLIVYVRSDGRPGAGGVRRVIVGTFALVGCLVLLGAGLALGLIVYIWIVCGGQQGHV